MLTNNFYVYEWFIIDTNHIFHVGKGQGNRYLELKGRNKSEYKLFKTVTDFRNYLNYEYDLGGRWCQQLMKQPFKISYQTKNNPKLQNFDGARAYKIPKKLFRSVTTMADECKPVGEILSLIEAHNN